MLAILSCKCPTAPMRIRRFLQQNGIEDWLDLPIYMGKESIAQILPYLPGDHEAIYRFIQSKARYILVVGYTEDRMEWADIAHGDLTEQVNAELILERFA